MFAVLDVNFCSGMTTNVNTLKIPSSFWMEDGEITTEVDCKGPHKIYVSMNTTYYGRGAGISLGKFSTFYK